MSCKHKHQSCCEHEHVKYCKCCQKVYCEDCGKEWGGYTSTWPYVWGQYPYTYTIGSGTTTGANITTDKDTITCSHMDIT